MAEENKLQEMIRTSLESIRAMVDANTVVGAPIQTPSGTTIIPISKVSVGYASGGIDFHKKESALKNFGGGGGTGLSVQPVCFLAVSAEGDVELIPLDAPGSDPVERIAGIIEQTPDILARIKSLFGRKKKKKTAEEAEQEFEDIVDAAADAVEERLANDAE